MRTKGATSNVLVSLKNLNRLFNAEAMIPVARRFADENGLLGKAMHATDENLRAAGNQPALEERVAIQEVVETPEEDGTSGQDRKHYTDTQDRKNYT
jgi:hypothetical protein